MKYRYIIVGGGSAGCVLANRLSAHPAHEVLLIEAGQDTPPGAVPNDIASPYAGRAAMNRDYIWSGTTALLARRHDGGEVRASYEQARVMGGGSSINGQVVTRGAPEDYDRWEALGGDGWNWDSVLPHFRNIESDLDFGGPMHGADGPIRIQRTPQDQWDGFTQSIAADLDGQGYPFVPDMNGGFEDGYSPTPLNTWKGQRLSSAIAFLDAETRARPNLTIASRTTAIRIVFEGMRAIGVEVRDAAGQRIVQGKEIILSCGAIYSPTLLMRSGVGPATHLMQTGLPVIADVPGIGANLQEHAAIHVSAYLVPQARAATELSRHNSVYLRYSSGLGQSDGPDMLMNFACRSGWHAVGRRLGTIQTYILQPFGRGSVRLASENCQTPPAIDLNLVGDDRDMERLKDAFHRSVALFEGSAVSGFTSDVFATSYSDRVRRTGRVNVWNRASTSLLAALLDISPGIRRLAIHNLVNDARPVPDLLESDELLDEHIRQTVTGVWHPAGTCRIGAREDPLAVTDSHGRVRGVAGLRVADNSLMPEVPRANTNLPAMMIGDRIAAFMLAETGRTAVVTDGRERGAAE